MTTTYRDIDYNTRINGSLLVSQPSVFQNKVSIQDIDDIVDEIKKRLPLTGGTISGNVTINGILTAASINGVDMSNYYTKTELQTEESSEIHWSNITNKSVATTSQAGIVQLSSAVNSTSETLAATPKAVKLAYDLANAKWTYNENTIKNIKINDATNADNADTVNGLTVKTAVPENAVFTDTVYTHPATHDASIITQDTTHKFVTDEQIEEWDAKLDSVGGTISGDLTITGTLSANSIEGVDFSQYYTKTDLSSTGTGSVHWNRISSKPDFANLYDKYTKWIIKSGTVTSNIASENTLTITGSGRLTSTLNTSTNVLTLDVPDYTASNGIKLNNSNFEINLASSSGLSISSNQLSNSDKGSLQSIYKNIKVGSSTATANSNNDTLTFTGSGKISASLSGKTVTFSHNDSDHTAFSKLADSNTFTANENAIILKPSTECYTEHANVTYTFGSNDKIQLLNKPVDSLSEVITNSAETVTYSRDNDYSIDYYSGIVTRKTDGTITSEQSVKIKYTSTKILFAVQDRQNTTNYLTIDSLGNIKAKSISVMLTSSSKSSDNDVTGNFNVTGNLNVQGNATFGDGNDTTVIKGTVSVYKVNADKTESLVFSINNNGEIENGSIDWSKVTNKVSATTTQIGIVQLSSAINSDSETVAATSKAVNTLNKNKWTYNEETIKAVKVNNAANADTVNGLTVKTAVPENAIFTDTTYNTVTSDEDGLMSSEMFDKLTNITSDATKVEASTTNGNIIIDGEETIVYTHPSGTNPHGTTKSDIGLGNVENKSSATIISEITQDDIEAKLTGAITSHTHAYEPANNNIQSHIADSDIHVTSTDKANWNGKTSPTGTTEKNHIAIFDGTNGKIIKDSGYTIGISVPADAKFTDTTYSIVTSDNEKGLMSSEMFDKLTGITSGATKTEKSSTNGNIKINGIETIIYTHPAGTNPHNTSKSDVGLGNVENKSVATILSELTKKQVTDALGYTPPTQNTTYGVATANDLGLVKSGTDITVDAAGNVSVVDNSHNHSWENITGKPSDYTPKSHEHTWTEITEKPSLAILSNNNTFTANNTFNSTINLPNSSIWSNSFVGIGVNTRSTTESLNVNGWAIIKSCLRITNEGKSIDLKPDILVQNLNAEMLNGMKKEDIYNIFGNIRGYGVIEGCQISLDSTNTSLTIGEGKLLIKDYGLYNFTQVTGIYNASGTASSIKKYATIFVAGQSTSDGSYVVGNIGIISNDSAYPTKSDVEYKCPNSIIIAHVYKDSTSTSHTAANVHDYREFTYLSSETQDAVKIFSTPDYNKSLSSNANLIDTVIISRDTNRQPSITLSNVPQATAYNEYKTIIEPNKISLQTKTPTGTALTNTIQYSNITNWNDSNSKKHTHVYNASLDVSGLNNKQVIISGNDSIKVNSIRVYKNGLRMKYGSDNDYTLDTATRKIIFNHTTTTNDIIVVDYDV